MKSMFLPQFCFNKRDETGGWDARIEFGEKMVLEIKPLFKMFGNFDNSWDIEKLTRNCSDYLSMKWDFQTILPTFIIEIKSR